MKNGGGVIGEKWYKSKSELVDRGGFEPPTS